MSVIKDYIIKYSSEPKKSNKKEYGYSFVKTDMAYSKYVKHLYKKINKKHLCRQNFQEPHLTLLYGYGNISKRVLVNNLLEYKPKVFPIEIYDVDIFRNECDVLVLKCRSDELFKLRRHLEKVPHTKTFKDYKPHITIAYLKPGFGKIYKPIIKSKLKKGFFNVEYIYYMDLNNNTMRYKLKSKDVNS